MINQNLQKIFQDLWEDYIAFNPHAKRVYDCFVKKGENLIVDHIALRTFDDPKVNIDALAKAFVKEGYELKGQYHFEEKKLFALHFEHSDPQAPKIFISELIQAKFSKPFQNLIKKLLDQVPKDISEKKNFSCCGRPWQVSYQDYEILRKESEYAAWVSAFGFRPNHFTVSVNFLKNFSTVQQVNDFLKSKGFRLNTSGGEIKGSKKVFLEQSSTVAEEVKVSFSDGIYSIPACYYEFAKRYPLPDGKLYQGFVEGSADKIFESTDRG